MKKLIFLFCLLVLFQLNADFADTLKVTHFALDFTLTAYEEEFLRITDNEGNVHFQGLPNNSQEFTQTLVLPLTVDTLYVALGDSIKVLAINNKMDRLDVEFNSAVIPWKTRFTWLIHDLEKVFPIVAIVIIFIIKKQRDRKKERDE